MRWIVPLLLSSTVFASEYEARLTFTARETSTWKGDVSLDAGTPQVPVKFFKWLVPFSEKVTNVELIPEVKTRTKRSLRFPTNPLPKSACSEGRSGVKVRTFAADELFPATVHGEPEIIQKAGYQILMLPIYPYRYSPTKGEGYAIDAVTLKIETAKTEPHALYRGTKEDREEMLTFLGDNTRSQDERLFTYPLQVRDSRGVDYLMIGPEDYLHNDAVFMFLSEKNSRGVTTSFRTLEDIAQNESGASTQEKVRNAIKAAYKNDGTRYVLLVGNGYSSMPSKKVTVSNETIYTDLYFGCLDDGTSQDWACEVAIGRAPVSTQEQFHRFIIKTLRLEFMDDKDPMRQNTLNFGEVMDSSTLGSKAVGQLLSGGKAGNITTTGYPSTAKPTKFYEAQGSTFSASKVIKQINDGNYLTIDHLGHANETYCMRFKTTDMPTLKNTTPFFAITQGCHPGNLAGKNWAEQLIVSTDAGAAAVIANSSFGWYMPGSSGDGPSNRFHLVFYDSMFAEKIPQLGRASYRAKERLIPQLTDSTMKKVVYETNLFGDPELQLGIQQN